MNKQSGIEFSPLYNANGNVHDVRKRRDGYSKLPQQDEFGMEAEYSKQDLRGNDVNLSRRHGIFSGTESNVQGEQPLCKSELNERLALFLANHKSSSDDFITSHECPPPKSVRIHGYYSRKPGSEAGQYDLSLQAFSFYIPLPKFKQEQRAFFSRAHDSPCFRGGRPTFFTTMLFCGSKFEMCVGDSMPTRWSTICEDDVAECWDPRVQEPYLADSNQKEQWDTRRRQLLFPPWLPLGDDIREDQVEEDSSGRVVADSVKMKSALSVLLASLKRQWSCRLISPQVLYGWDANLIHVEVRKLLPKMQEPVDWDKKATWPISTVKIDFETNAPFIVIRLFRYLWLSRLCQVFEYSHWTLGISSVIFSITSFLALLLVPNGEMSLTWAILMQLPTIVFIVVPLLCSNSEGIHDTVGLAWALKSWISTGIPASNSREEVVEHLRQSRSSLSKIQDDEIYLQKRSNGWYVLLGTREGDWLATHRDTIEGAMRTRKVGTMDVCNDEEVQFYRQVRDRWEGDDGVGIAR